MSDLSRRGFLRTTSVAATTVAGASLSASVPDESGPAGPHDPPAPAFTSDWHRLPNRTWIGPEFWANPLQDWRLNDGRLECVNPARNRNVHLLTRSLNGGVGEFTLSVTVGRVGGKLNAGKGTAGFRIAIRGPLNEYRNNIVFGSGMDAGITSGGTLFIGNPANGTKVDLDRDAVVLTLTTDGGNLVLTARDAKTGDELASTRTKGKRTADLSGNIALVNNFGPTRVPRGGRSPYAAEGLGKFWFRDLKADGPAGLGVHPDRAYGPILFAQYTLHEGTLKMTAQMPPVGEKDDQMVEFRTDNAAGVARIDGDARTATFEIPGWSGDEDVPYRLLWTQKFNDDTEAAFDFTGTIRRDPVDEDVLTVADISCNIHAAFPNHVYTHQVRKANPDLVTFVGDQFYESTGGYGVTRQPVETAILDLLHKWYLHGWTWRDVIRDRPSIAIPDDHDVYQGNIWGEAGAGRQRTQEAGGYGMPVRWVNVVHRTQTSHHPAPHTAEPLDSGITVYHGPLTYGRVSFAILADRMWKTGPDGVVPPTKGRADHVTDPNFDPATADVEGAELLGERQLAFLDEWAADWRGADLKAVVSQTIFTSMATTHGGPGQRLVADYDANGWPQTARNAAVRAIRKCFAVHLAGDQHLPAVVHYGVDEHRDAGVAFAGPAVNVGYPRWWEPRTKDGKDLEPLGDHRDHLGHPLTVLAVQNGAKAPRRGVVEAMTDKASGLGLVRFNKRERTVTFECWPFNADTAKDEQFEHWPVVVKQLDNGPSATHRLPTLKVSGASDPVITVRNGDGEVVYALRARGTTFTPPVYAAGRYKVTVADPDGGKERTLDAHTDDAESTVRVDLS